MFISSSLRSACSMLKIISFSSLLLSQAALANGDHDHGKASPSSHAPIGMMADHRHDKGESMFSYRYMNMNMQGNRVANARLSDRSVIGTMSAPGQFMVVPTQMPMRMHMLGGMFGLSDSVTLLAMLNYVDNSMDHLLRNGNTFTTASSGLGDAKIGAIIGLIDEGAHSMHFTFAVSLPTGSIKKRDDTPAMSNAFLPYPMQLGSGTYDFNPSVTYRHVRESFNIGLQSSALIRISDNDQGYTLGDEFGMTAWVSKDLSSSVSTSLRLNYKDWQKIDGANPLLNPRMIQTANTDLYGGERLDASLGINYLFKSGHRLALEYAVPVKQNLNGPQLETDSVFTIGWQKAF